MCSRAVSAALRHAQAAWRSPRLAWQGDTYNSRTGAVPPADVRGRAGQRRRRWNWSVPSNVTPPAGHKPLADYPTTDPAAFPKFMRDRAAVERFRSQVELYVGQVRGANPADPTNSLGRVPE